SLMPSGFWISSASGPPSIVKPSISSLRMTPPARSARSRTTNERPCRDNSYAVARPAMPPPMIATSTIAVPAALNHKGQKGQKDQCAFGTKPTLIVTHRAPFVADAHTGKRFCVSLVSCAVEPLDSAADQVLEHGDERRRRVQRFGSPQRGRKFARG